MTLLTFWWAFMSPWLPWLPSQTCKDAFKGLPLPNSGSFINHTNAFYGGKGIQTSNTFFTNGVILP